MAREKGGALIYALSFAFALPLVILLYETAFYGGSCKKRLFRVIPFLFVMLIIPLMVLSAPSAECSSSCPSGRT